MKLGVKTKFKLSKTKITKAVITAVLVLFLFPSSQSLALTQQEAQNELDAINQEISSINSTLNNLSNQKKTLANELAILDTQVQAIQLQINAAQAEINLTNQKIAETNSQIEQAEADLKKQRTVLAELLKTMYIEGQTSTMELIVTSDSFSDFIDKSEYLNTMSEKVQNAANQIIKLKSELDQKKNDLQIQQAKATQLKAQAVSNRVALDAQVAQRSNLLAVTRGNESVYQSALANKISKKGVLECIASGGCRGDANGDILVVNQGLHYYQWQNPWGPTSYDGNPADTYANYGCLITSLAMYHGITPPEEASRHRFTSDGYMYNDSSSGYSIGLDWGRANQILATGGKVMFKLDMGGYTHFVLAIGTNGSQYFINDPYFTPGTTYRASRVMAIIVP